MLMRVIYNSLKFTESFQNPFHKINCRAPLTKEEKLKKTFLSHSSVTHIFKIKRNNSIRLFWL